MIQKFSHYKEVATKNEEKIIFAIGFIMVAVLSFGAGKLSEVYHTQTPIIFQDLPTGQADSPDCQNLQGSVKDSAESADNAAAEKGKVIGNKNSRIYHLQGGAFYDKISPENRVYFDSEEEARKAGYRKSRS